MPLPLPNLDDRHFQDLVDEAKRRIPHYCPEWTDHNVSDPGVTLIELFAGMVDTLLYKLNQVPNKNYIAFMNLLGLRLEPPIAAKADLTFWLSEPSDKPERIPTNTEVETDRWRVVRAGISGDASPPQPETPDASIRFSTDAEFVIYPATNPPFCLTQTASSTSIQDHSRAIGDGQTPFPVFSKQPVANDAFYLGDSNNISAHILGITFTLNAVEGLGIRPDRPPLRWEAWCGEVKQWQEAEWESDTTRGLNENGRMTLYLPKHMQPLALKGRTAYWLRCVCLEPTKDRPGYSESPVVRTIRTLALGGTVEATHSTTVNNEILGISTGEPGQRFQLEYHPVLERRPSEQITVQHPRSGTWHPWQEVADFGDSRPSDEHYVIDSVQGEVRFGPLIREPSGLERQFGARPDVGGVVRMASYRIGGGTVGNVGDSTITLLKTAVPRIDRVTNRRPARGGLDAETLDHAMLRAPRELRSSSRAVVAEDFEHFARKASRYVARARCLQPLAIAKASQKAPQPGQVRVLIVPQVHEPARLLDASELQPSQQLRDEVQAYLDERRLLTTFVTVEPPDYIPVSVVVHLRAERAADKRALQAEAERRLYRFLNPLVGGPDGQGWPFGRNLNLAAIFSQIQTIPGVAEIIEIQLRQPAHTAPQSMIQVADDALIMSGTHQIEVTGDESIKR